MEYELEESRICTAYGMKNVEELGGLLNSSYLRNRSLSACKLYILGGCGIDIVQDKLNEFKFDEGLMEILDYAMEQNRVDDVCKLLNPGLWEDFVIFLEQFCKVLRVSTFLDSNKIDCLRVLRIAKRTIKEEDRRAITEYLLLYCEFKINRRPDNRQNLAISAVNVRPGIPYPDEHRELLCYLGGVGVDIIQHGYDPDIHGSIQVKKPEDMLVSEMVGNNRPLLEILKVDSALAELLHNGYTIDFAVNSYTM